MERRAEEPFFYPVILIAGVLYPDEAMWRWTTDKLSALWGPPLDVSGDILFVGSPTRTGKMTRRTAEFLENFDAGPWRGRRIVAFDTVGPLSKDAEKRNSMLQRMEGSSRTAAGTIQKAVTRRGLAAAPEQMHLAVTGMWGPLAPDARDMAMALARKHLTEARRERSMENVQMA